MVGLRDQPICRRGLLLSTFHRRPRRYDMAGVIRKLLVGERIEDHGRTAAAPSTTSPGPRTSARGCGSGCAGGRLAHAFQEFLENGGVIELSVFGAEQKGQLLAVVSQVVELFQSLGSFRAFELLQVTLAKRGALLGVGVEPFAQAVGRSQRLEPGIDRGSLFPDAARPQAV